MAAGDSLQIASGDYSIIGFMAHYNEDKYLILINYNNNYKIAPINKSP